MMRAFKRRNISQHHYLNSEEDGGTFEVYETDEGWWWSFSPVWRDCGPFHAEAEAILAGSRFEDELGLPYIQ